MFCSEQFADELAEAAGMDPVEWRRKWAQRAGDPAVLLFMWGELAGGNYAALLTKAAEAFEWEKKWKGWKVPTAINGAKRRGVGAALSTHPTGVGESSCLVRINLDGTVTVNSPGEDIGQGINSATAICVAEVLGVRYEDVTVTVNNTMFNPRGGGVAGSRGTPVVIGGCTNAALDARAQLLERAAKILETNKDDLDLGDGKVFSKTDPEKVKTIAEIASADEDGDGMSFGGPGIYAYGKAVAGGFNPETEQPMYEKSLAAACCEVEVDTETGAVEIIKIVMACDCGTVINPVAALAQVDGGVMQGFGNAMYEEMVFDKNNEGIIVNANYPDYKIPTFLEYGNFTGIVHSDPADAPTAPFNAKGMSEGIVEPVAPAVANAIYNATGARVKTMPMTPDKVLAALGKI
jgi:CO/xanthine dehydrogenase Mo-binding subunit